MGDAIAWNYLTVEDPGADVVRLRDSSGYTIWGLRRAARAVLGITIVSADGTTVGSLHYQKENRNRTSRTVHALYGPLFRVEAGGLQPAGEIKLLLPVGGLNDGGRRRFKCREMVPVYTGDKQRNKKPKFQYHVLLGSRWHESPELD